MLKSYMIQNQNLIAIRNLGPHIAYSMAVIVVDVQEYALEKFLLL